MKNSTQRPISTMKSEIKEIPWFIIFIFSIMQLLNTILSKNIVWGIILIFTVKGVFSQGAAVPNSNIQLERPQMNLTTLLSRGNINSSFILYSTSSCEVKSIELGLENIKDEPCYGMKTSCSSIPVCDITTNSNIAQPDVKYDSVLTQLLGGIFPHKQDKEKMSTWSTLKCCTNTVGEMNTSSHTAHEKMTIWPTLKCYINTADGENPSPHTTHEKMSRWSTLKCYINTADDKNPSSHSTHEKYPQIQSSSAAIT